MLKKHVNVANARHVMANGLQRDIKAFVNDSWIGTSKFLYFYDPDRYLIWDSRVARALKSTGCRFSVKSAADYSMYCEAILDVARDDVIMSYVRARFPRDLCQKYYFQRGRVIEAALYVIGKRAN